jgi:hypothetical protein
MQGVVDAPLTAEETYIEGAGSVDTSSARRQYAVAVALTTVIFVPGDGVKPLRSVTEVAYVL